MTRGDDKDHDDSDWLDALAGRKSTAADSPAAHDASLLREALRTGVPEAVVVAERDAARELTLIDLAKRRGILPLQTAQRGDRQPRAWGDRWFGWRAGLAFVTLACLAVALTLIMRPAEEREIMRGNAGVVRVVANDPRGEQQALLKELTNIGVEAAAYEQPGRYGVDMELRQPLDPRVVAILRQHHVTPPARPDLRVEFQAKPPR